jgi:hypothetical protein
MPFLEKIYTALLASSQSDSSTDDTLVGILNQDGIDVVHVDLGMGPDTGACILCPATIIESQVEPRNHYLRIGIRGDDAFLARVIAAWGVREGTSAVVPLG